MPELPEVESLRRSLLPYITDRVVTEVTILLPKIVASRGTSRTATAEKTATFIQGVTGRNIKNIHRRAKNLIIELDNQAIILVHLKMTGQLVYKDVSALVTGGHPIEDSETQLPNKHTYLIFRLDKGTLYYNDVRQFGYVLYYPSWKALEDENHFANLGKEPFDSDFTLEYFTDTLKVKRGNLKKLLLDQAVVVGLGNIYADETCFAAKVRPTRNVQTLKNYEIENIYKAIITILPEAVALGGSSVANYLLADGSRGNYAREHKVYKRGGLPCLICGKPLTKTVVAGRTTVYCEHDQK